MTAEGEARRSLGAVAALLLALSGCLPESVAGDPVVVDRFLMGTAWSLQIYPGRQDSGQAGEAALAAFDEVARIERLMSEWLPDSQLSAINAAAGVGPVSVDPELRQIVERSISFGELTSGAFDITWRSMGDLWVFDDAFRVPGVDEIAAARSLVDFKAILVDGDRVGLPKKGMALGLGGIAKGYAVDRAAALLSDRGFGDFLLDGGGDLYASGSRDGRRWRVGIRHPDDALALIARLQVRDRAVVTSGDYERYRIVKGTRYHHIIDPRSGMPARGCRSVSVVARTTETADVLATAVFVLGPAAGLGLVERLEDVEALIVGEDGQIRMTSGLAEYGELVDPDPGASGEVR